MYPIKIPAHLFFAQQQSQSSRFLSPRMARPRYAMPISPTPIVVDLDGNPDRAASVSLRPAKANGRIMKLVVATGS
jgi:hypothetical protein